MIPGEMGILPVSYVPIKPGPRGLLDSSLPLPLDW